LIWSWPSYKLKQGKQPSSMWTNHVSGLLSTATTYKTTCQIKQNKNAEDMTTRSSTCTAIGDIQTHNFFRSYLVKLPRLFLAGSIYTRSKH
jgi:hypothetical protein